MNEEEIKEFFGQTAEEDTPAEERPAVRKKRSRAKFRIRRFCAALILMFLFWWFNNYTIKINKLSISSDKVTSTVRLTVVSDQHVTKHGISNKRILRKINKTEPDIVMIMGDMYTRESSNDLIDKAVELIQSVVDEGYMVYVVTGEHDTDAYYKNAVRRTGAKLMDYQCDIIEVNGARFQIIGIDNVYYSSTFDLHNEFELEDDCYSILLAHIPNYEKFAEFGADLTICADTHGSMIQLPFGMGPLYYSETGAWMPEIRYKDMPVYDKGLFSYNGGYMFITSGLGAAPAPIRFNNRPEVAVIDIIPD